MKTGVLHNIGLLILRVGLGLTMLLHHGLGKFVQLFSGEEIKFADPIGIGVIASFILVTFAEFLCALAVTLGAWTRWAAMVLTINMAVIVFIYHGADSFDSKQLQTLFLVGVAVLVFLGSVRYTLDAVLKK